VEAQQIWLDGVLRVLMPERELVSYLDLLGEFETPGIIDNPTIPH